MSNVLRLAIVDPNDSSRNALKTMLLGMDTVWLEAECSRYEFFADVISQTHPGHRHRRRWTATRTRARTRREARPDVARTATIVVMSVSTDGQVILQAMRAGAKEFLTHPVKLQDVLDALTASASASSGAAKAKRAAAPSSPWHRRAPAASATTSLAGEPRLCDGERSEEHRPRWSISICASATPTSSSIPFPTTRWSTSRKTSPGSTSRCSSARSPSTRRGSTYCPARCKWKTWRLSRPTICSA
jgi:DNA-binding NarL/FixJ family response regulator